MRMHVLFILAAICVSAAGIEESGFRMDWTGNAGFSVAQSNTVIIANSLLLCMEPPWKSHWYYGAKHAPLVTRSEHGLTVATDPAKPSPFAVEYHRITAASPDTFAIAVRGILTENVSAFVTHVVANIPEAVMSGAKMAFDAKTIDLAAYYAGTMPDSPPWSVCEIRSPKCDITVTVKKGSKLIMQDRREKPYLGAKGFIIMEQKAVTLSQNDVYEQEVSFTVRQKSTMAAAAASEIPPAVLRTKVFFGTADERPLEDIVRAESAYGGKFSWDDYRTLLAEITKPQYRVLTVRDLVTDTTKDTVVIGMRHDIDSHPEKALAMAKLEHEAGIRSTYYILHSATYYGDVKNGIIAPNAAIRALAKKLSDKGFEIGIHTDLFSMMWKYQFDPVAFMKEEIERYRTLGITVTGAAAHGDGTVIGMGLNNMWMFSEFGKKGHIVTNGVSYPYGMHSTADYGLSYEAYLIKRDVSTGDIDGRFKDKSVADLAAYLASLTRGTRVIILTHPEHWGKPQ
ncbi:MAG: hypothetical protein AABZ39_01905 [Spirochaetota bacterium]